MTAIPPEVQEIADRLGMTPIAWKIKATEIVVCFQEGPKISMPRQLVELVEEEKARSKASKSNRQK